MDKKIGSGSAPAASLNENKDNPWGSGSDGGDGGSGEGGGPKTPWGQPPRKRRGGSASDTSNPLDDFIRKSRERFGGRITPPEGKPYWFYGAGVLLLLWIFFTSVHMIGSKERGVITRFGRYAGTLQPGLGFTFPSPVDTVQRISVGQISSVDIGSTEPSDDNLILTGDENIVDMAYTVRWSVNNPENFLFRMADPEKTIPEVAQSAMRAVVARESLDDVIGSGRSAIEQQVADAMQRILDFYGAGVTIQGVSIRQSDPPAEVNDAFKEVSAAQQQAVSAVNQANAYALQITARAQGEAAAFDKVYAQYKLAPEVTRRRMYYDTMEQVLSRVDKTIIEAPGVTPYLPLPALRDRDEQQGNAQ